MNLGANLNEGDTARLLAKIRTAIAEQTETVLERAAVRVLREVVERTPKRWFGQVRRSWQIVREKNCRLIKNPHKVMGYLEFGTADEGRGFIYPQNKKALYIPFNRKASFGWSEELQKDEDYILRKRVHGIKPRRIVERLLPWVDQVLVEEMRREIRRALAGA